MDAKKSIELLNKAVADELQAVQLAELELLCEVDRI